MNEYINLREYTITTIMGQPDSANVQQLLPIVGCYNNAIVDKLNEIIMEWGNVYIYFDYSNNGSWIKHFSFIWNERRVKKNNNIILDI